MHSLLRWAKSVKRSRRERRERAPAEVVIVSYPKSGRTWLRMLIGKTLCDRCGLPEDQMLDTLALTQAAGLPATVFSHDGSSNTEARHLRRLVRNKEEYRPKRVLYLSRDPRDVVISCFFQTSRRTEQFDGDLSDFIRDPHYGIRKILTFTSIWQDAQRIPREFEVVRYEAMKADPEKALRTVLEYMGILDLSNETVAAAVEFSKFENMKKMEQNRQFSGSRMRPGASGDPESNKVRRGIVGGYVDYLSDADVAYCDAALAELWCPLTGVDPPS
jgi:hypothetical protein